MAQSVVWIAGVGAVAGLGAALARRFAREDYRVAVSGRSLDKLQTVVADIEANGGKANAIVADVGLAVADGNAVPTIEANGFVAAFALSAMSMIGGAC